MAELPPETDSARAGGDDLGTAPDAEPTTGAPRWVKAFAVIALVLVVLVVVLLLAGGGNHGPGRHSGSPGGGQVGAASDVAGSRVGGHAARAVARASR